MWSGVNTMKKPSPWDKVSTKVLALLITLGSVALQSHARTPPHTYTYTTSMQEILAILVYFKAAQCFFYRETLIMIYMFP